MQIIASQPKYLQQQKTGAFFTWKNKIGVIYSHASANTKNGLYNFWLWNYGGKGHEENYRKIALN